MAFMAGANGMLIGGYLTLRGREAQEDRRLVEEVKRRGGDDGEVARTAFARLTRELRDVGGQDWECAPPDDGPESPLHRRTTPRGDPPRREEGC